MTGIPAESLPPGRWAVAVSGGADSVALLRLLVDRADVRPVVVHLDHGLRGDESDADAAFVRGLAARFGLPFEVRRLTDADCADVPNPSARYRAARLAWFHDVARPHACDGIVLAHHADDQAETVVLRLLRGRSLATLGGMRPVQRLANGLALYRPLLAVRRADLRAYLLAIGQPWREDSSNTSPVYRRNALRQWLAGRPDLTPALLRLADASRQWQAKLFATAPHLGDAFDVAALRVPLPEAEHAVRTWLVTQGCPVDRVSLTVCRRLIDQATNAGASPRQHYPGGVLVRRRARRIDVVPPVS